MSKRVLIIGGGVIGLWTAYYCARRGFEVIVVERKAEQRDGCSFGNAGMIVPSHFIPLAAPGMVKLALRWMWNPASPLYIKPRLDADFLGWGIKFMRAANAEHVRRAAPLLRDLSLASRKCFEEFAALPNADFGLVKKGLLMLCKTSHALEEEAKMATQANSLGVPAEVLDAKQTAALDPGIRMDIAGAIYFPLDCHLTTHRFMAALQKQTESMGVRFAWGNEALDLSTESGQVHAVKTRQASIEADEFAADAVMHDGPFQSRTRRRAVDRSYFDFPPRTAVHQHRAPHDRGGQGRIGGILDDRPREHADIVNEIDDGRAGGQHIAVGGRLEKWLENDGVLAPLDAHRRAVDGAVFGHCSDDGLQNHVSAPIPPAAGRTNRPVVPTAAQAPLMLRPREERSPFRRRRRRRSEGQCEDLGRFAGTSRATRSRTGWLPTPGGTARRRQDVCRVRLP